MSPREPRRLSSAMHIAAPSALELRRVWVSSRWQGFHTYTTAQGNTLQRIQRTVRKTVRLTQAKGTAASWAVERSAPEALFATAWKGLVNRLCVAGAPVPGDGLAWESRPAPPAFVTVSRDGSARLAADLAPPPASVAG